ncbi:tail protein [Klebsiella phage vB_KpnS_KpV522]|uniref:Putative tail fiber protein n=1 Tax=Klebsiella phage vB_KpnS_KpV522 TaxID=1912320 RepID=A0A1I9SEN2_9CAUD|nr:tail protein [Klebsiella phage vB_KpnS_KpV522]AOZ65309.1 putative tail fiber protein [Klebsiella phage vB_KpnS_KpV522]
MTNIKARKGGSSQPRTPVEMPDNLISKDKIKLLLAVSDGEVVDDFSLKQLHFGGVPVQNEDGTFNYEGVIAEFRPGTQTQDYIQGFSESSAEFQVARDVTHNTPYTLTVSNKNLSAIRFRLLWPRVLTQKDNGDMVGSVVEYKIEMAVDGASYQTYLTGKIDGKNTTGGYDRSIRVNLPQDFTSQVLIRVSRVTPDADGVKVVDAFQVQSYAEVIDAKFRYPLTAMLYVEFDSDLFQNQIPTISLKKKWKIIQVPSNYDPINRTYSGTWDGVFKWAWSNNPAWVLYDLIMNQRYGLDQRELGIPVDKWSLYEVAQYCDELVPDNRGGMEPRYLMDVIVQSQVEAFQLVRDVCSAFRGMTFYNGESLSIIVDKPRDPVYLFTADNVVDGVFVRTFPSEKTMYTSCNVMFDDEENQYEQDVEPVFNADAAMRFGHNPTSITAIGCTRRTEANRRGRWILQTNLSATTVSFSTGLEGMIPSCGDVIYVADPHWQSAFNLVLSGRIMEVTGTQVFLAFRCDAKAGDTLILNTDDGKPVRRTIASVSADGKTITLNVGFNFDVAPDSVFLIESDQLAAEQYVVTRIEKGSDDDEFTFAITATQYNPNKYDAIDNGVITDDRPTSVVDPDSLGAPKDLTISSFSRIVQGMSVETMVIGWSAVQYAKLYEVQWRKDGGNWNNVPRTATTQVDIEGIYAGEYQARVRCISGGNVASPWSALATATLTGKVGAPKGPINLFASDNEIFGIRVKWAMPEGAEDTAYIELYQSQSGTDQDASLLTMIPYPASEYWHSILPAGYVNFYKARSVDRIGNVSAWTDYARGMSSTDVNAITDTILDEILDSDAMKELQVSAQDSAAKLNDYANSIIQNALANDGDVRIMRKENGKRKAEIKRAEVLIANETEARVQQVNQISAEFNENLNSGLTQVNEALANETEARVTSEEALSARIGQNSAALDQKLDSWANVNGVGSMYTMKLGLTYNGQEYNSGMALQLTSQGGNVVSQVLFIADRFAIIRNAESGAYTLPFVVQNDQVFMNNALIQDGSITNAKIGNVIQSNNYIAGQQGWVINKNGGSEFNNVTVRGHIEANSGTFKGTIEAQSFIGDIAVARRYDDLSFRRNNTVQRDGYYQNRGYGMTIVLSCTLIYEVTGGEDDRNGYIVEVTFNIGGQQVTRLFPVNPRLTSGTYAAEFRFSADIPANYSNTSFFVKAKGRDANWDYSCQVENITATAFRTNSNSFT